MDHPPPPEYREPHNRRSSFSGSDDVLIVRTVMENLDIFSFIQSQRTRAWKVITQCLCDQGITCTTESVRCRTNRLAERYQAEFAEGQRPDGDTEITPLEQLLAQYIAARNQFERRGNASLPGLLHDQSSNVRTRQVSDETHRTSDGMNDSTAVSDMTTPDLPDVPLSTTPASGQEALQSSKKPRKRRFYFESEHDEILLKLMLADEGVITASGVKRPQWKKIEAEVNSRGMRVNTHTIRTHLRLLVDAYRKEEGVGYIEPDKMSEKQRLLSEYCRKLDDTKQSASSSNENQFLRLTQGNECERCRDPSNESRWRSKPVVFPATSEPLSRAQVPTLSGSTASFEDFPATVHVPETAPTSSPDHLATSTNVAEDTATLRSETAILHPISMTTSTADRVSPGVASVSSADCPSSFSDSSARPEETSCTEAGEPASKKRKVRLDTVLDRFISMQRDHYREQREYERAVTSEQRTLQRQTIELQTRALDIQEKSMGMQERLMAMMEKVMDKLN
uniref:Myb-like domain-containing protein n=1 Tax=Peronospora matthiolae TaxID=2874970 RepID=A0AAV1V2F9_9STRA